MYKQFQINLFSYTFRDSAAYIFFSCIQLLILLLNVKCYWPKCKTKHAETCMPWNGLSLQSIWTKVMCMKIKFHRHVSKEHKASNITMLVIKRGIKLTGLSYRQEQIEERTCCFLSYLWSLVQKGKFSLVNKKTNCWVVNTISIPVTLNYWNMTTGPFFSLQKSILC